MDIAFHFYYGHGKLKKSFRNKSQLRLD